MSFMIDKERKREKKEKKEKGERKKSCFEKIYRETHIFYLLSLHIQKKHKISK